jgi:hypothetical protein
MSEQEVIARGEIGLGRITDSPEQAVDSVARSLPAAARKYLKPLGPARKA